MHPQHSKLILAVSGGVDSVVLTDLVAKAGYDFIIAHCNFQLRGPESHRDEAFVKTLETKYNKTVLVKQFDTEAYAVQHKLSIQEAARKLRYEWFAEVASPQHLKGGESPHPLKGSEEEKQKAIVTKQMQSGKTNPASSPPLGAGGLLLTAHHANDNIETLLINFFRGTGISGLHGIPAKQGYILRPLLFAKREDILEYAKENNLQWVEDSTNALDKYTRNFIRLQMLPAAKEIFTNAEDNLLQNIERFKEAEIVYLQSIDTHKKKLLQQKGNEWHIPILKLQKAIPLHTITWEIIKAFSFNASQTAEVIKLLQAGNGSYISSPTHRIIKNRAWLIIAPAQTVGAQHILIEEGDKKIVFENGSLTFEFFANNPSAISNNSLTATLDASQIKFPLLLRKWKQGDYFYPLGMDKKKKLSRFFIDLKLSATDKEKVWVLEMDKKIIWVTGLRIDNRFKITPSSQNLLKITLENGG